MRSRVRLYTPTETASSLSVTQGWTEGGVVWVGFVPAFLTLRNYGAGEQSSGRREIEGRSGIGLTGRMGLEVLSGPEAGTKWRVLGVDDSNRKRTTATVEPYHGEFA